MQRESAPPDQAGPRRSSPDWQPAILGDDAALDPAIERSLEWCALWWKRLAPGFEAQDDPERVAPWLAAIPDIGPTCEVLLADALFHDLSEDERSALIAWVRSQQRADGSWAGLDGETDLSLTCLGYWARVQHGDDPEAEDLALALRVIHGLGGARRANLTVRLWLALAGAVPWDWVPAIPSELYLLPAFTPLSPARLSPWARQLVCAVHLLAESNARVHLYEAGELLLYNRDQEPIPPRLTSPGLAGDLLQTFDRAIKLTRALPRGMVHRRSLAQARSLLDRAQQSHGGWFSTRPTLYALLALRACGESSDDPRILAGLRYLRSARGLVEVGGQPLLAQGLNGPSLAKLARLGAVLDPERIHGRLLRAEIAAPGPWQRRVDAPSGGWPNELGAERHLDLRATCAALSALRGFHNSASRACLRRAAEVTLAMQEPDGSFARFERGEADVPLSHLPWRDADQLNLGAPESEGRVAHTAMVLRELSVLGWRREDDRVAKALAWLSDAHAHGGHEWSLTTLAEVLRACAAQCPPSAPLRQACEAAMRKRQLEDGSFGDPLSTARALIALLDLIPRGRPCVQCHRAARQLVRQVDALPAEPNADDLAADVAATSLPGFGLSPRLRDPSAGVREIHIALVRFRDHAG